MKCFVICKVMKFYMMTKFFCAYLCKIMIKSKLLFMEMSADKRINVFTYKALYVRVTRETRVCYTRVTFVFRALRVRVPGVTRSCYAFFIGKFYILFALDKSFHSLGVEYTG